ncbi:MAG: TldD/PmbA family protein, partial [Marinilabiliales bacterium]
MTKKEKYKLARWAMEFALNNGAEAARVSISNNNSSEIEVRDNKIDKLQEANQNSMSIDLYVENKYSSISTNRLNNKEDLEQFIKDAISGTRFLAEDEFRTLPDQELYYKGGGKELKTVDPEFWNLDPQEKVKHAFQIEKEVLGKDERIISMTASYNDSYSGMVMVASNGFEGDKENTSYSVVASVSVKDGDSRPQGYWWESSLNYDQLISEGVGEKALKLTLERLGQK